MLAGLRHDVRGEAVHGTTNERRDHSTGVSADREKGTPGAECDGRGDGDVVRHDRSEQERDRGCHRAHNQDGQVPHEVDPSRRIELLREERISQMTDRVWRPAQGPHVLLGVAGCIGGWEAAADPGCRW